MLDIIYLSVYNGYMINNEVFNAIQFATKAHQGQFRKGTTIPYVVHPMTVGFLAYSYSKDTDLACAGLLHDTIEDTEVTYEDIEKNFNKQIADLVFSVTEEHPEESWKARKERALARVDHYTHEQITLKSSDVIANCQDILRDYAEVGEELWKRFNTSGKKGNLTDHYKKMLEKLSYKATISGMKPKIIYDLDDTLTEMNRVF